MHGTATHSRAASELSSARKSFSARRQLTRELFLPLPQLISSGGDERLASKSGVLNAYGCAPFPIGGISELASSTATSISANAFYAAELARLHLINRATSIGLPDAFDERVEEMRTELRALLDLDESTDVVFAPSGTDAMLQFAFLATEILGGLVANVVAVSDETGSGVPAAIGARHFSGRAALGEPVAKGDLIDGISSESIQISVPGRSPNGAPRGLRDMDEAVLASVQSLISAGRRAVLYAMDCSKTGIRAPSLSCLSHIAARWPEDVQIVIDACQMRLGRARLKSYLESGFAVVITGSKYFTGPAFSGALLIPQKLSVRCATIEDVPQGLSGYTTQPSWPRSWQRIRDRLPEGRNFGEWIRWEAALSEMTRYFRVPQEFRARALTEFERQTLAALQAPKDTAPVDNLVPGEEASPDADEFFGCRTIFPFRVATERRGLELARQIYDSMNHDIETNATQDLYPDYASRRAFHIGQPVTVADWREGYFGALRISASSRIVSESWIADDMGASERLLQQACRGVHEALLRATHNIDFFERSK